MKLWQKGYQVDKEIEKFTVGNDYLLDKNLVKYDVYGSIAHAKMLNKINVLNNDEFLKLKKGLIEILNLDKKGKFTIKQEDEDVHTAVENFLVKKLGNTGKKIHTARSRNDQVLVDTRLYSKEQILKVTKITIELIKTISDLAIKYKKVPMPGYTHTRKAMPSSVGLLFGAYAESLMDNFILLDSAYKINNQNPLGSAAGYGVNLNIDRELTAKLLGFDKIQNNVLYVQNSRGKIESSIVFALSKIMEDLSRISNDLIYFTMEEFGYFSLPDKLTTGSSIMPQKKNPDVLELVRAKSNIVESNLFLINNITKKLPSGYNRDLQIIKEPLIKSFDITISSLSIMNLVFNGIIINKENCINAFTKEIFATDEVLKQVKSGIPMRTAYKKIAENPGKVKMQNPEKNILLKKHIGSAGNLGLDKLISKLNKLKLEFSKKEKQFESIIKKLTG